MIVVAIIAIAATCAFSCGGCGQKANAEQEMRDYMTSLGYTVKAVNCVNRDSDGDGYVSCTGTYEDKNGNIHQISSECASTFSFGNSGCRAPKMRGAFSNDE